MIGKKSGDAVQDLSGVFTITGDGAVVLPEIQSISIRGAKKLFVFGDNFAMGSVVEINGTEVGTLNDEEDPLHFLRCKKGAKKIPPGDTVAITVLNPDGSRSAPFMFTRPLE